MDCLAVSGSEAKILRRLASAFLISQEADFLTAAHVVTAMQQNGDPCPTPAITLVEGDWRPDVPIEAMLWFPFIIEDCKVDDTIDVAECRPSGDWPARIRKLHKATPVQLEWSLQPDGTELAFTGFPLKARDPMTFLAHVAAYETPWPDQATPQTVLDHAGLPGFSGSPVFLANGKVIAIQVKDGSPDAPGTSIARPSSAFRKLLEGRVQKE
jgi:V8-like Glu-specific endopeptidase